MKIDLIEARRWTRDRLEQALEQQTAATRDAARLGEVVAASTRSMTQHISAIVQAAENELQQYRDWSVEAENRIVEMKNRILAEIDATGMTPERDLSLLKAMCASVEARVKAMNARIEEMQTLVLTPATFPFPLQSPITAAWELSGHTDTLALRFMLAPFEATLPPVLFSGLNEVLRRHPLPDGRHMYRWLLVFEGHYVKHLSWEKAYEYASERLAGTSAGGGPDAMATSYKLHRRRLKSISG